MGIRSSVAEEMHLIERGPSNLAKASCISHIHGMLFFFGSLRGLLLEQANNLLPKIANSGVLLGDQGSPISIYRLVFRCLSAADFQGKPFSIPQSRRGAYMQLYVT